LNRYPLEKKTTNTRTNNVRKTKLATIKNKMPKGRITQSTPKKEYSPLPI